MSTVNPKIDVMKMHFAAQEDPCQAKFQAAKLFAWKIQRTRETTRPGVLLCHFRPVSSELERLGPAKIHT